MRRLPLWLLVILPTGVNHIDAAGEKDGDVTDKLSLNPNIYAVAEPEVLRT